MARTKQTARYSTGGSAPLPILYGSDYSESGDDSSHQSEETDYSLLSSEETSYDKGMKLELIKKVLHNQELLRLIYIFSGENNILMIHKEIYYELKKYVLILSLSKDQSQMYYKNIIDNFLQQDMQTKYDKPKVTKPQTKK